MLGVVGSEPGLLWTGLQALDRRAGDRTATAKKNKKEEGPAGASLREKIDCLEGECFCVPFIYGVA